jgi:hypothetical protein
MAGCFFLNAARIRQHDMAGFHHRDKIEVIQRVDQSDIALAGEGQTHHIGDVGIGVQRIDDRHILAPGKCLERLSNFLHPGPEILPSMGGYRDDPLAFEALPQRGQHRGEGGVGRDFGAGKQQRVDHRVACDVDRIFGNIFST